jgi:hypothetical protein
MVSHIPSNDKPVLTSAPSTRSASGNPSKSTNFRQPPLLHLSAFSLHPSASHPSPNRTNTPFPRLRAIPLHTAAHRFCIAAPAIVSRIRDHARTPGIQVNTRCHLPCRQPIFHDQTLEPILPQRLRARMHAIETLGKTLQHPCTKSSKSCIRQVKRRWVATTASSITLSFV